MKLLTRQLRVLKMTKQGWEVSWSDTKLHQNIHSEISNGFVEAGVCSRTKSELVGVAMSQKG